MTLFHIAWTGVVTIFLLGLALSASKMKSRGETTMWVCGLLGLAGVACLLLL